MRNVARTTIVALLGLAVIGAWPAPQAPAQDRQQQRIEAAIAKAVEYLKSRQAGAGEWSGAGGNAGGPSYATGPIALVGIALLECGVGPNEPVSEKAAKAVRQGGLREVRTYQLSLAIQFLDRLGEFNDVPLIQVMSLRLMLGQDARSGGWTYNCVQQINDQEVRRLLGVLPPNARPEDFDLKQEAKYQAALQQLPAGPGPGGGAAAVAGAGAPGGMGDNSNTQFAVLTLWIAKRHHVPCDECL